MKALKASIELMLLIISRASSKVSQSEGAAWSKLLRPLLIRPIRHPVASWLVAYRISFLASFLKFNLAFTDIWVDVKPPLRINRYAFPSLFNVLSVKVSIYDGLGLHGLRQNLRIWIGD